MSETACHFPTLSGFKSFASKPAVQNTGLGIGSAVGIIIALGGVLAFLALYHDLPRFLEMLQSFDKLGQWGAIACLAAGGIGAAGSLTALFVRLFYHRTPEQQEEDYFFLHEGWRIATTPFTESVHNTMLVQSTTASTQLEPSGCIENGRKNALASRGVWGKDQTYPIDSESENGSGNVDFSYANPYLGFSFVLDGSGHSNPMMYPVLKEIVERFIQSVETELNEREFQTLSEAKKFVDEQMVKLALLIHDEKYQERAIHPDFDKIKEDQKEDYLFLYTITKPEYLPAISFSLVVKIGNKKSLLTAQFGDAFCVIQSKKGIEYILNTLKGSTTGLNGVGTNLGEVHTPSFQLSDCVRVHPLSSGDRVFHFTDGVGEFLTHTELNEVLRTNENSEEILSEIKAAIEGREVVYVDEKKYLTNSKGDYLVAANFPPEQVGELSRVKQLDPKKASHHDDMSFSALVIQ